MSVSQATSAVRFAPGSRADNLLRSYIGINGKDRLTEADVERRLREFNVIETTERRGGFFGLWAQEIPRYEFVDQVNGYRIVVTDDGRYDRSTTLTDAYGVVQREQTFTNAGVREGQRNANGQMDYTIHDQRLLVQDGQRRTDATGRMMAEERRNADGWTMLKNIGRGVGDAVRDPWTYVKVGGGALLFTALAGTAMAPALPFIAGGALLAWGASKVWQGYQATRRGGAAALTTDFSRSTANETTQIAMAFGVSRLSGGGNTSNSNNGNSPSSPSSSTGSSGSSATANSTATTSSTGSSTTSTATTTATPASTPTTPQPNPVQPNPAAPPPPNSVPANPTAPVQTPPPPVPKPTGVPASPSRTPVTARQPRLNSETRPPEFEPVQNHLTPVKPSDPVPVVAGRNPLPHEIPAGFKPLSQVNLTPTAKPAVTSTRNVSLARTALQPGNNTTHQVVKFTRKPVATPAKA